jgi:hypothetical protein
MEVYRLPAHLHSASHLTVWYVHELEVFCGCASGVSAVLLLLCVCVCVGVYWPCSVPTYLKPRAAWFLYWCAALQNSTQIVLCMLSSPNPFCSHASGYILAVATTIMGVAELSTQFIHCSCAMAGSACLCSGVPLCASTSLLACLHLMHAPALDLHAYAPSAVPRPVYCFLLSLCFWPH